ncbi:hypothetical protein RQM47_01350 [Rubrivirga sp. S365]|uniref:Sel1 repeat-containing protein n=1 Tax=Rubrivirga litoralis TaxID=3075598 RepID=A0ABU3BRW2_9BACT|nr:MULTISPECIES: hypothetical protein [unclassified Rubrivirga]MDT0632026.1 hypothetical protein [Rubrivirga sp. F394]MDT7855281.1 hypothetical protein [Rubrivirga sp. S365]
MRLPALVVLLLSVSACEGGAERVGDVHPDSVYAFESGQFEPDSLPGIERLDAAAAQGDPDAQFKVAFFRHHMTGDYEAAVPVFERLAASGHPDATAMLATVYMYGNGVEVDHDEAARWLERAATLGHERAARDLAAYRARQR